MADQMTKWKCPEGHTAEVPAYDLAEIGTPYCGECEREDVEMEPDDE